MSQIAAKSTIFLYKNILTYIDLRRTTLIGPTTAPTFLELNYLIFPGLISFNL
ncbi:hypothetical protein CLV59_10674 [Chitinophaga dinghuensis]|uniref:Uncharacterized protein n=1 Tax=Chitinophaga dinghuensis TaxID=1539050 RepID=A0A327VW07_9BACT|nr:hypothetical protein CLV59_10674 [Chitinophaga dinghuensis]